VLAYKDEESKRDADLAAKFDRVDFSDILSPPNLATPSGIAASKGKVAEYRALLAERKAMQRENEAGVARLVASIPPGPRREAFEATASQQKEKVKAVVDRLDSSQSEFAIAIERVLEWAEVQPPGALSVKEDQLQVTPDSRRQQLLNLVVQLNKAAAESEKAEEEAVNEAKAISEKFEAFRQAAGSK
jgi:hypothetical protein